MPDTPQVPPLFERELDSVPGPFYVVKDQCIICALPVETAPANITWSAVTFPRSDSRRGCPTHCRIERQPQTPEELARVIEAAWESCVEAIRYCGTDPQVLAAMRARGLAHLCDALPEGTRA